MCTLSHPLLLSAFGPPRCTLRVDIAYNSPHLCGWTPCLRLCRTAAPAIVLLKWLVSLRDPSGDENIFLGRFLQVREGSARLVLPTCSVGITFFVLTMVSPIVPKPTVKYFISPKGRGARCK